MTTTPRRSAGSWFWATLCLALLAMLALALYLGVDELVATWGGVPLDITIDGEPVARGLYLGDLAEGHKLTVVAVLLLVVVLLALVLPVLLVALIVSALVLALTVAAVAVGAPVIAVGAVLAVVGLALALPLLLLWRLLRWLLRGERPAAPGRPALPPPSATMPR